MRHITLLTDYGTRDGMHTLLRGVIWQFLPDALIADLTHDVEPQNIYQAALVLMRAARYFPDETVHIVAVAPGKQNKKKGIAAQLGNQYYVGPDTGICTPLLELAENESAPVKVVELTNAEYWLEKVNPIFLGRDIFAPVGAHLAGGVPLDEFGPRVERINRISIPCSQLQQGVLVGEVISIDKFGNLVSSIRRSDLETLGPGEVYVGEERIGRVHSTFDDKEHGDLIALYSSFDYLLVAVNSGSASERLKVRVGAQIRYVPG